MSGCYGNHPEDRARERELDRYMDELDRREVTDEMIEEKARDMIENEKSDYYPFKPDNILEAISELDLADKCLLGSYAHVASKQWNSTTKENLAEFFMKLVEDYWLDVAKHNVERDF